MGHHALTSRVPKGEYLGSVHPGSIPPRCPKPYGNASWFGRQRPPQTCWSQDCLTISFNSRFRQLGDCSLCLCLQAKVYTCNYISRKCKVANKHITLPFVLTHDAIPLDIARRRRGRSVYYSDLPHRYTHSNNTYTISC